MFNSVLKANMKNLLLRLGDAFLFISVICVAELRKSPWYSRLPVLDLWKNWHF